MYLFNLTRWLGKTVSSFSVSQDLDPRIFSPSPNQWVCVELLQRTKECGGFRTPGSPVPSGNHHSAPDIACITLFTLAHFFSQPSSRSGFLGLIFEMRTRKVNSLVQVQPADKWQRWSVSSALSVLSLYLFPLKCLQKMRMWEGP